MQQTAPPVSRHNCLAVVLTKGSRRLCHDLPIVSISSSSAIAASNVLAASAMPRVNAYLNDYQVACSSILACRGWESVQLGLTS